ncbi:tRNA (N(6)-L-threonylcarbamoyladenosine(37)-C(2))-methylthiotransferase [Nanoarchaeota archaeon]
MTKIAIITFGCSLNQSDSETMLSLLKESDYQITQDQQEADLIIINSCTVKHLAEKKLFKTIENLQAQGKKLVIAGCVAQAHQEYLSSTLKHLSVIGTKQLQNIAHIVEETLNGNIIHAIDMDCDKRLCIPIIRRNPVVGIVPLSEGCLGNCTYCKTRQARGPLISYNPKAIKQRVEADLQSGCKEIWLTSQDCGAYGLDIDTNIITLLKSILEIKGDHKIRLGMSNPNHILQFLDPLIDIYKNHATEQGNLFCFLHIPIQSADNQILKAMNRKYTVEEFTHIVTSFRKAIPNITIATDIIVGFPGEAKQQFESSLQLIQDLNFDVMNISRFWSRPNTPAASLPNQIHGRDSKERSQIIKKAKDQSAAKRNQLWKDWQGKILIDEQGPTGGFIGRNYSYKPITIPEANLGDSLIVTVQGPEAHFLKGKIVTKQ